MSGRTAAISKSLQTRPLGVLVLSQGWKLSHFALLTGLSFGALGGLSGRSVAINPSQPTQKALSQLVERQVDIKTLKARLPEETISKIKLTIPSLWWVKEKYVASNRDDRRKLIENWIAYPADRQQPAHVDVLVNRQLWSLLNYLDRYTFINQFGPASREDGYNLRIVDGQSTVLAAYACNVAPSDSTPPANSQPMSEVPCEIYLDSSGKAGFRSKPSNPLDGGGSSGSGTAQP